jgi:hypothetical protein
MFGIMKTKYSLLLAFAAISVLSACKKTEEPINNSYKCECGTITWLNENLQLTDISYIQIWPDSLFSRQYYATAEMRDSRFEVAHSVNVQLVIPNITWGPFFPEEGTVGVLIEEVNYAPLMDDVREFAPVEGVISVSPGIGGSQESVSFNLNVKEVINGNMVGFPLSVQGTLEFD